MFRRAPSVVAAVVLASCTSTEPTVLVRLDAATAHANPHNVLSAVVSAIGFGDSAAVRYRAVGQDADSVTPAVAFQGDSVVVPVLGLLADTAYTFRIVAWQGRDSAALDSIAFATGSLPAALPSYSAGAVTGGVPLPGYVVFSAGMYGLVIDNTGRVVWYRAFPPTGPGLNFMAQPTGHYVGRPAPPGGTGPQPFVVVNPLGDVVRDVDCANGRTLRFHDLILLVDGGYWIMCDDTRVLDLTAWGGVANARVTATVVQRIAASGSLLREWNAFDHFQPDDLDPLDLAGAVVNFTHGNALELDADGNILVSFRSLNEITKLDANTGALVWRLGGRRNQFTFAGTPDAGFRRQHNVRLVGAGRLALLDNVGSADSRFERYRLDTATMTAHLEQSYAATPPVLTAIGGSVQVLEQGRYLVSFGTQGRVEEFDATGATHWRINGNPGYVFRAQRIRSLYFPGVGSGR